MCTRYTRHAWRRKLQALHRQNAEAPARRSGSQPASQPWQNLPSKQNPIGCSLHSCSLTLGSTPCLPSFMRCLSLHPLGPPFVCSYGSVQTGPPVCQSTVLSTSLAEVHSRPLRPWPWLLFSSDFRACFIPLPDASLENLWICTCLLQSVVDRPIYYSWWQVRLLCWRSIWAQRHQSCPTIQSPFFWEADISLPMSWKFSYRNIFIIYSCFNAENVVE